MHSILLRIGVPGVTRAESLNAVQYHIRCNISTTQSRGWWPRATIATAMSRKHYHFQTLCVTSVTVVILTVVAKFAFENNATVLDVIDSFLDSMQEMKDHLAQHAYSNGNYAPVAEERRAVPLEIVERSSQSTESDFQSQRKIPNITIALMEVC